MYCFKKYHYSSTVKEIGTEAFYGAGLTSIQFEDGIEKIGSYAAFCSKGTIESITIPASVTEIGEYVFNKNLKSVHFWATHRRK